MTTTITNMASNTSSVHFSEYFSSLEASAKARYKEKVNMCGFDPYSLKSSEFKDDFAALPPVEYPDIVNYLVLQTSWLTNSQMKAYKSLEAYNFFISGWVSSLLTKESANERVVVFARVNHSQRTREPPLKTWFLAEKTGDVLLGHCSCMAGLGEACSHVGALLFACETAVKMRKSVTCTQEISKWLPSHVKKVPYLPVSEVNFSSAKRQYKDIEDKENVNPKAAKRLIPTTTAAEEAAFFKNLSQCKVKSAVLSLVPPYNKNYKPNQPEVSSLKSLYKEDCVKLSYEELLNVCNETEISITERDCRVIEQSTRKQSASKVWFEQRSGRITASKLKSACHTDPNKPSKSLVNSICYPEAHQFKSSATNWGCTHENIARQAYERQMCACHEHFVVSDSGLNINKNWPHMGASPDGFVNCDCCGRGACEIKCPFTAKDQLLCHAAKQKNFCLVEEDGSLTLNKSHAYYYQVQAQLFICELDYCDFVVWTLEDIHIERILPDHLFWKNALAKATKLFRMAILPELVGRWFTRPSVTNHEIEEMSDEEGPWCYCQEHLEGSQLIGCDNKDCKIVWFHMDCLGIDKAPKGEWQCPSCKK